MLVSTLREVIEAFGGEPILWPSFRTDLWRFGNSRTMKLHEPVGFRVPSDGKYPGRRTSCLGTEKRVTPRTPGAVARR